MLFKRKKRDEFRCEMYTEDELERVEEHIKQHFGDYDNVFHEIISPDIHVDIAVIEPSEERNYYTLVTMGMGAHRMDVPEELADAKLDRAEIMINLPPEWDIHSEDEDWYWPLRWLKIIARLPGENDTWVGWGHTIPSGEPIANTHFECMMLISPVTTETDGWVCGMPDGSEVNFYQMVPLYEEEMVFKLENDAEPLLQRMDDYMLEVVDIDRENVCADMHVVKNTSNLRERADAFWEWFTANEEKLSEMIENRSSHSAEEIVGLISDGVSLIADDMYFNIGGDHEFTFSVEDDVNLFHTLPYVISRMPEQFRGKWKFFPYMQGTSGKSFKQQMYGITIDADDIQIAMDADPEERKADIGFFNKKMMKLPENEMYSFLYTIMRNIVGEGMLQAFVRDLYPAEKKEKGMFPLTELEEKLKTQFAVDELDLTDNYTAYSYEPEEIAVPRMDVIAGTTTFPELVQDYYNGMAERYYQLRNLGTRPVFIFYAHDREIEGNDVVSERYEIAEIIEQELGGKGTGKESAAILGGAAGTMFSYIDILVYDEQEFFDNIWQILDRFPHIFFMYDMPPMEDVMHHISTDADIVKELQYLHDSNYHQMIADVIGSIPENERGFTITGIYGRALNNLDRENEALDVLMSIKEQGQNDGVWNFRVGYSLFYTEREKEAYPYFQKAYELGDHDPQTVYMMEMSRKATMTDEELFSERRQNRKPDGEPFVGFDTSVIWDEDDEEYHDDPPSDEFIRAFQERTGYKLPVSYIKLMKEHNGGLLALDQYMSEDDRFFENYLMVFALFSLGNRTEYSVCRVSENFEPDESIGIPIGDSPFTDDGLLYLDYRFCGKDGEPEVACIDNEKVKFLADDFESFVRGLYTDGDGEDEEYEEDGEYEEE